MMNGNTKLGNRAIFLFWSPLALTWLMMSAEGPILAAVIARLAEPKANLAAYGVAFAIAILIEAPIIMIMSAATALVKDRESFVKLRTFTYGMNGAITLAMVILLFTPAMDLITRNWIGLPDRVAFLVWHALVILLPWPGAIGYRRFYQGVLIQDGQTRKVAYGTVVRLSSMAATALVLYLFFDLPGAYVGAAALTAGVFLEAVAARLMAAGACRRLIEKENQADRGEKPLTYREIGRFYYPLALTSTLALAVHPMVALFVGHSRFAIESLAVIPVINSLVFMFRAIGLSYLEATIALMGKRHQHYRELRRFAGWLAFFTCAGLGSIALTPLSGFWFEKISGLDIELAAFAVLPTMILGIFPALSVLLSLQRAVLVTARLTPPITWSTMIEVAGVLSVLYVAINGLDMVGVTAAAIALLSGRIAGTFYLVNPCRKVIEKSRTAAP